MKKFTLSVCTLLILNIVSFATQLSGTYTINPAAPASTTNFKNIYSAITYMNGILIGNGGRSDGGPNNSAPFGVSGPVIFNLSPGNYGNEQVYVIDNVIGNNAINTITFQKLPGSVGAVIFNKSQEIGRAHV